MDLSDLYSQRILEIAASLPDLARLADADASGHRVSRICGSVVDVDLKLADGHVSAYGHEVSACALGQTSASVVARHILGATPDELRLVRSQMHAMLKENGPPPSGARWEELRYLEPVREYRARHASTLLVFDAVVDALDAIDGVARGVA